MKHFKEKSAAKALEYIENNMVIGLGTGSTADIFTHLLAEKIHRENLLIKAVPTSIKTASLAEKLSIPLVTLENYPHLDCVVDGADEVDSHNRLIKGGGGALLCEKIVASATEKMIVIADPSKKVDILGKFPLPVEVIPFGFGTTFASLQNIINDFSPAIGNKPIVRKVNGQNFITDQGHWIVDLPLERIENPEGLSDVLLNLPGVIDHGLFLNYASIVFFGNEENS